MTHVSAPGLARARTPRCQCGEDAVTAAGDLLCMWHTRGLLAPWEGGLSISHLPGTCWQLYRAPFLWVTDCSCQTRAVVTLFIAKSPMFMGQIFHTYRSRCTVYYIRYYISYNAYLCALSSSQVLHNHCERSSPSNRRFQPSKH